MGMSQNPLPVEGIAPIITYETLSQNTEVNGYSADQTFFDGSTVLLVSSPSGDIIREESVKQPVFVVTELPSNNATQQCTYIQVPTANLIQMPQVAPNTVNLIQVPTINVEVPSNLLVANNNLILCVPPEGLTLQMQPETVSNVAEIAIDEEELMDIQSKTTKAKSWHADSDIANRALMALSSQTKQLTLEQKSKRTRRKVISMGSLKLANN